MSVIQTSIYAPRRAQWLKWPFLLVIWFWFVGAAVAEQDYQPVFTDKPAIQNASEYVVAIYPLHNPERLVTIYGPIIGHLAAHARNLRFRLEASRNYEEFEKKFFARQFHFVLANPYQVLRAAEHGYKVFGKMGDDIRGIILVRRDGGIEAVNDLKGKKVSYPAPTALAATMLPQYFLQTQGVNVTRDIENVYVGSQESSIMNVYHGFTAAAGTRPALWEKFQEEHPNEAQKLTVKWQTETLPNNGLVMRDDVSREVADKVAQLLFTLHESEEGRRLLSSIPLSKFEAATEETFEPVRAFLSRFYTEVRPVSW